MTIPIITTDKGYVSHRPIKELSPEIRPSTGSGKSARQAQHGACARMLSTLREGMGVEPTAAGSAPPATDFEDQGAHRDTTPPTAILRSSQAPSKNKALKKSQRIQCRRAAYTNRGWGRSEPGVFARDGHQAD